MNLFKNLLTAAKKSELSYYKRYLHGTQCLKSVFLDCSPNAQLERSTSDRYLCLPIPEPKAQVSYVFIDGTGLDLRARSRVIDFVPSTYKDCPNWTFDASCCLFECPMEKSDYYCVPIAMYPDPFRRGHNKIALCETFTDDKKQTKTNKRQACIEVLNKVCDQEAMFGFQQEFYLLGPGGRPFGWPCGAKPLMIGKNYSGIGTHRVAAREIIECVTRCCLYAGVDLYGSNPEDIRSVGNLNRTYLKYKSSGRPMDYLHIIQRVAEDFGLSATFRPCPRELCPVSGMHATMSTKTSRNDGGLSSIQEYIKKLEKNHQSDIKHYNISEGRNPSKFKSGVGDRSASIRISPAVADKKKGFLQDRRPGPSADPYTVITTLVKSCLL